MQSAVNLQLSMIEEIVNKNAVDELKRRFNMEMVEKVE